MGWRLREAARLLFLAQGYAATTTKQIASSAGVTERTLFNHYAGKSDLLRAAVIEAVVGDVEGATSTMLPDFQAAMLGPDPSRQVAQFARAVTRLHGQVSPLAAVCRQAAATDVAAAEFYAWGSAQQRRDCETFVRHVSGLQLEGYTLKRAVDAVTVLSGHEVYWQLVVDFSWTPPTYRGWLQRQLEPMLVHTHRT